MSLFDGEPEGPPTPSSKSLPSAGAPLAERMRPRTLEEYSGQEHLLGPGKPLRVQIERDARGTGELGSMIFWVHRAWGKPRLPKSLLRPPKPASSSSPPS